MSQLILEKIGKTYPGNVIAVTDVNLDIKDKEFIVLVGPSGCGKTTTLRMIAGLEEITEGSIYLDGKLINDLPPKDRNMAMVFQNYALYPHMTVYDNMAFSLKMAKKSKKEIKENVGNAAKILGLEDLLKRKPKALSGGQRQRVALGRAIVRNPRVFLFDEPLSNLDAKLRTQMRMELLELHQRLGTTFVYVTHDQMEAMTMGTRIVVMKDGFIHQVDSPQKLYDNPCNIFVATFIGAPQINILDAHVVSKGRDLVVQIGDTNIELSKAKTEKLKAAGYESKKVKLGIRPEDICLYHDNIDEPAVKIKSKVLLSEPMGSETHVHISYLDINMTMKMPSKFSFDVGEFLLAAILTDRIHIFDAENEMNIIY